MNSRLFDRNGVSRGTPRASRRGRAIAAVLCLCALGPVLIAGCKSAATRVAPAQAFTVPEWNDLGIKSVAYMGTASSVGDETARVTVEGMIEQELRSGQDRFVILGMNEARSRANGAGAGDLYEKMVRVWRNDRKADLFLVQELCRKAGVDGLVFGNLTDWMLEQIDWTSEGTSATQVSVDLVMYSGKSGLVAWQAQRTQRKESIPYRPDQATGVFTDPTGAERAERPASIAPKPPRPEEVALEAIRSVVAALPPVPNS